MKKLWNAIVTAGTVVFLVFEIVWLFVKYGGRKDEKQDP